MRISDCSSDVCSSDLLLQGVVEDSDRALVKDEIAERLGLVDAGDATEGRHVHRCARRVLDPVRDREHEVAVDRDGARERRSEERRVGKEGVCKCHYRWGRYLLKTNKQTQGQEE